MTDHAEYLKDFLKKGIQTYACEDVWAKKPDLGAYKRYSHAIDESQFKIGSFVIKPFPVPHTNSDGSDCPNYGFLLYSMVTKEKMIWATDCAYIPHKFPACEYLCIECNYIDFDDYKSDLPYLNLSVERRRIKSHMSLNHCVDFVKQQDLSKIKYVKLLHLSRQHGIIEDEIKRRFAKEFPDLEVRI